MSCWVLLTELDGENPDFDKPWAENWVDLCFARNVFGCNWLCVCDIASLKRAMWTQHISALDVAQSYSVSLRALFGKEPSRPNFCSIADSAIIHGSIGSPGSPYLIPWSCYIFANIYHHSQKKRSLPVSLIQSTFLEHLVFDGRLKSNHFGTIRNWHSKSHTVLFLLLLLLLYVQCERWLIYM